MVRFILLTLLILNINAGELEKNCLNCHIKNQLPTNLIYKKYLMRYSTNNRMKKAILNYLKSPEIKNSIMPKQFFIKFNAKNRVNLNDSDLNKSIDMFLDKFDVKKRIK